MLSMRFFHVGGRAARKRSFDLNYRKNVQLFRVASQGGHKSAMTIRKVTSEAGRSVAAKRAERPFFLLFPTSKMTGPFMRESS